MLALHEDASSFPLVSHLRNSIAIDYYYDKPGELLLFWTDIAADIVYRGRLKGQGNLVSKSSVNKICVVKKFQPPPNLFYKIVGPLNVPFLLNCV